MGNLVITRKKGEAVNIGGLIDVTVELIQFDKVRLSFSAPNDIPIYRQEILDERKRLHQENSKKGTRDV